MPPTTATSTSSGTVNVGFGTAWDYDDELLKYELFRNGVGPPIHTTQISSNFWTLPTATYTDTGVTPGTTAYYQVRITDPNGNTQWSLKSDTITVCCAAGQQQVIAVNQDDTHTVQSVPVAGSEVATPTKRAYIDPAAPPKYHPVRRKGQPVRSTTIPASSASLTVSADGEVLRQSVGQHPQDNVRRLKPVWGAGAFPRRPYTAITFNITNRSDRPARSEPGRGQRTIWCETADRLAGLHCFLSERFRRCLEAGRFSKRDVRFRCPAPVRSTFRGDGRF